jgi:DNA repair exonuclease SbcCD ATPase subunit
MSWRILLSGGFLSVAMCPLLGCSLFERHGPAQPSPMANARNDRPARGILAGLASSSNNATKTKPPEELPKNVKNDSAGEESNAGTEETPQLTKAAPPVKSEPSRNDKPTSNANTPPRPASSNAKNASNARPTTLPPPAIKTASHTTSEGASPSSTDDVHIRPAPTAFGSVLNMPPGETPIEKALELTKKVEQLDADKRALNQRMTAIEEAMLARDKQMNLVTRQVQDASDEVIRARKDLQMWSEDLREQQRRLREQEKENQELLKMVITTLEKIVGPETMVAPKRAVDEH